ncbi:hypothetical protein DFH11DRAFT_1730692 [Phellopilus nigrolimitatus]|nr:hypothetical protein DFH11DRAFT_1730692 [Phellopilus nigrolimitatus]
MASNQSSDAGNAAQNANPGNGGSGGDALDKGVDFAEKKSGHEMNPSTTEKISDGIRTGFKKMTGKDVPIKDQEYK